MKSYLMVESQSEYEAASTPHFFALAQALRDQGAAVEIMLVQNGVLPARAGAHCPALLGALKAGIGVFADEFSLRERALPVTALVGGIKAQRLDLVIERLGAGWNVLWH